MNIARKLTLWFAAVLSLFTVAVVTWSIIGNKASLSATANLEASDGTEQTLRILSIVDSLMLERVHASMALLKEQGANLGGATLSAESVAVSGRQAPQLYLGLSAQANNYDLVDKVTATMGGTATLFVKSGNEFVRISTNVMKNGARATGTILSHNGRAIAAINKGKPYYGKVDILGTPYLTGYEPMHDDNGRVIGIWYVGYKADLVPLMEFIESSHVMKNGFLTLVDDQGEIRGHSNSVNSVTVKTALQHSEGWQLMSRDFESWGYKVIAAYPVAEINNLVLAQSLKIIGLGIMALLVLLAVLSWVIRKSVVQPIQRVRQRLSDIANGEGDLTLRFNYRGRDELVGMTQDFDRLLDQLCNMVCAVKSVSTGVHEACEDLADIARESHDQIHTQSSKNEHVLMRVSEVNTSLQHVTQQISAVSELTTSTNALAQEGSHQLNSSIQSITLQASEINDATRVISELNDASTAIGSVLEVIQNIAEQTNLLALNAAIEAARAGEQGRGFAVVADEVRSLAKRTQESTEEIKQMIDRLLSGAEHATQTMSRTSASANQNLEEIASIFSSLEQIMNQVAEVDDLNRTISAQAEQQRVAIDGINHDMQSISVSSSAVRQHSERTSGQSKNLDSLVTSLRDVVGRYKTQ